MKKRDLMNDYLGGHLSREDLQNKLPVRHAKNQDLLAKVTLDDHCRRVLSSLRPPDGAADRLAQVVLSPDLSEVFQQVGRGGILRGILQSMPFDVVGAGQSESKRRPRKMGEAKTKNKKGKKKSKRT